MRKLIAAVYDDLDAAEGIMTEAETSVTIGWEGRWYEVDLTKAHAKEAELLLRPYIGGGTLLAQPPQPRKRRKTIGYGTNDAATRAYFKGMRDFADASNGKYHYLTYPNGTNKARGNTYSYNLTLRQAYAAHLRAGEGATSG